MNNEPTAFSVSASGIAATYTQGFQDVLGIIQEPDAQTRLLEMTESPDIGVALYGLAGLRLIRSDLYEGIRGLILKRTEAVLLGKGGCCFRASTTAEAIRYLEIEMAAFSSDMP